MCSQTEAKRSSGGRCLIRRWRLPNCGWEGEKGEGELKCRPHSSTPPPPPRSVVIRDESCGSSYRFHSWGGVISCDWLDDMLRIGKSPTFLRYRIHWWNRQMVIFPSALCGGVDVISYSINCFYILKYSLSLLSGRRGDESLLLFLHLIKDGQFYIHVKFNLLANTLKWQSMVVTWGRLEAYLQRGSSSRDSFS